MSKVSVAEVDPDEAGMRLDRWFGEHYPNLPFGQLQKLLRTGQIRVDSARAKSNTRLEAGQSIRIPPLERPAPASAVDGDGAVGEGRPGAGSAGGSAAAKKTPAAPRKSDLDALKGMILHEDPMLYVLNKPAGLAVQGGSGTVRHVDGMLEALRDDKGRKPRLVHRLDKDTSGVLVVARTKAAASALAAAFRHRTTKKVYWALVRGVPKPRQGRISTYLAKGEGEGIEGERMQIARHGDEDADHAVTLYSVVDQAAQNLAWMTLRPITGRTHQLRAHMNHLGHPIIGDPKYFDIENWDLPAGLQNRLHLHARRLIIPHPKGGTLDVSAPLPPHMVQSWNLLGLTETRTDPDEDEETFEAVGAQRRRRR